MKWGRKRGQDQVGEGQKVSGQACTQTLGMVGRVVMWPECCVGTMLSLGSCSLRVA